MKPVIEKPPSGNSLPALLRRFGVLRVTAAATLMVVIISIGMAAVILRALEGGISGVGVMLAAVIPLAIAPISLYHSFRLVHRLDMAEQKLRILSDTDELTGVFNRRHFFERAAHEFERGKRYNRQVSVAILDFDNFKRINDVCGHLAGDAALIHVAQICAAGLRQMDIFARYGGDEFIFLLPDTDVQQAKECLDRILDRIGASGFQYDGRAISIHASVGISEFHGSMADVNALMREADFALYAAKHQGGMRVIAQRALTEV